MKKIALLAVFFTVVATHQASAILGIKVGPEVGLNISSLSSSAAVGDIKSLSGLRAGLTADVHIFKPIYVQLGAHYSMQGATAQMDFFGLTVEDKLKLNYINIPLNVMYKHDLVVGKVFAGVGPYWGIGISGKETVLGTSTDVTFGSDATDVKRVDMGVGFNAGFQLKLGAFIRAQYQLGLTNLSNVSGSEIKNRNFSVSVGWLF